MGKTKKKPVVYMTMDEALSGIEENKDRKKPKNGNTTPKTAESVQTDAENSQVKPKERRGQTKNKKHDVPGKNRIINISSCITKLMTGSLIICAKYFRAESKETW